MDVVDTDRDDIAEAILDVARSTSNQQDLSLITTLNLSFPLGLQDCICLLI